ncbi:hypothetical protein K490DRAFT_59445 [Saccharata proteae CBS 121410]|uniref:Chromatin assembly factor 1 subunit A n=1 Tax=Saccharata proteae CBS 121410 TaxID=1314787 RepID=A0A9P4LSL3_9PEZI|nr:hypothetical protein K490DRAFT_59445 [Saccharata proteae CBS 121410]
MSQEAPCPSTPSRKRPAPDDVHDANAYTTPAKTSGSPQSDASSPLSEISAPDTPVVTHSANGQPQEGSAAVKSTDAKTEATQAVKRRKLTAQEKEEKEREKELKEKARAEKKAKKDEEARLKEEERKAKAEERRKKKEEEEKKLREKDLKKQQKEEEQKRKERSQMKLNAFFAKPSAPKATAKDTPPALESDNQRKSTSLEPPGSPSRTESNSPQKSAAVQKKAVSDYERTFLPFELRPHTICAPYNWFLADSSEAELENKRRLLNRLLSDAASSDRQFAATAIEQRNYSQIFPIPAALRGPRGIRVPTVKQAVEQLHGSSTEPIDLTSDTPEDKLGLLASIPMKYLHFGEDVRPPYFGTFTKVQSESQSRKMARNPFSRALPELNYDYDSEAEWEEPEGEDIDIDDEEDLESHEGDEDMEGFLDDEEDTALNKRKLITGDLEPTSSGLCWEDDKGALHPTTAVPESCPDFADYKIGVLLQPSSISIDPFSTAYWQPEPSSAPNTVSAKEPSGQGLMNPPRLPLHARPDGVINGANLAPNGASVPKPLKRLVPPEMMAEFKATIQGSDMTKLALIEALKKKFPKMTKDAITNTLPIVAKRVGSSNQEKRWALIDT